MQYKGHDYEPMKMENGDTPKRWKCFCCDQVTDEICGDCDVSDPDLCRDCHGHYADRECMEDAPLPGALK